MIQSHTPYRLAEGYLRAQRDTVARRAIDRQYARYAKRWAEYGASGRDKSIRDMGYHIDYLAEALGVADPALFISYVAWAKILFASLGFDDEVLENTLSCLRETVAEQADSEVTEVVTDYIEQAIDYVRGAPRTLPSLIAKSGIFGDLATAYLDHLLNGRRQQASRLILDAVQSGVDVRDIYIEVFQPVQREVGRLWQTNEISVAQEHFCTAATQLVMSQLYPYVFGAERMDRRFVGTCVGGELHEMGVRMVADFFEMEGWDTYYLGANTPTAAIKSTIEAQRVDVLGISATMTFHIPQVSEMIAAVRDTAPGKHVKILVGGYPFLIAPDLWRRVGADGWAPDAQQAVVQANQWFESER
jgi:MerR family transcriptional regulator, light-induced transcriptional regulator